MQHSGLGPLSGRPSATPAELADIIVEIRAKGFAQYRNEQVDAAGVAAPVFRGDGTILGSLGITAPARRLSPAMVPQIAEAVKAAARQVSELLGFRDA